MPTIHPASAPVDDVRAVTERVADLERVQHEMDVQGMIDLFDRDAVCVTGGGQRLIGYDAIAEFARSVLPGAFADGSSATYTIDHVSFLSDDIVLTGVLQRYFDPAGLPASAGLPSYVWRRAGDTWKIVVFQNTSVPAE
jgi:uncharacterized protein (TIGR02246 family)